MNVPQNNYPPQSAPFPPGWYQDPWNPAGLRWWNGVQWTQAASALCSHQQQFEVNEQYRKQTSALEQQSGWNSQAMQSVVVAPAENAAFSAVLEAQDSAQVSHNSREMQPDFYEAQYLFAPIGRPSDLRIGLTRAMYVVCILFRGLAGLLALVFVLSIVPVNFTSFGRSTLAGMRVEYIADWIAYLSIIGAVLSGIIAIPLEMVYKKTRAKAATADACEQALRDLAEGSTSFSECIETYRTARFMERMVYSQANCMIAAFVISGIAGWATYDFLLLTMDNPWVALITHIVMLVISAGLGGALTTGSMKKYMREDSDLYEELKNLI